MDKLTLDGMEIVWDEPSEERQYFVGPKAIQNLEDAGVLDEWIANGWLKFVTLPDA